MCDGERGSIETLEGCELTVTFVKSLANYLTKHGWEKRVLFHIHDEPDIHYQTQEVLEARKRQYYLAAGILRKYIPGIRIIEAVDSAEFRGGIDIWVPGTAGYEKKKEEFDTLIRLGETVWTYVCCGPEGHWLNRFLDFALLKGRMLFWGCAKNRISGFLHWGLNQFPGEMNPYEGTELPEPYGNRHEFSVWRFFPHLSWGGRTKDGNASGGTAAWCRRCCIVADVKESR